MQIPKLDDEQVLQFDAGVQRRHLEILTVSIVYPSGHTHILLIRIAGVVQDWQFVILFGSQVRQCEATVH